VNFQITKATAPKTAIPPATDNPTIVPVPTGVLLLFPLLLVFVGGATAEEELLVLESLCVTVTKEVVS
jgi:hypothetical protein